MRSIKPFRKPFERRGLPRWGRALLAKQARNFLGAGDPAYPDFREPQGEPALVPPDSISWQVFKNPLTLFIGGVTAVILELAEPRVRSGVWEHTTFRTHPVRRLRRTGLAAMVTIYGARSRAEAMIAGVNRMHERVGGVTPEGMAYRATDPELLDWVQATAQFGFLEAYRAYAHPLSEAEASRFYAEGQPMARLYGAMTAPDSEPALKDLFARMHPKLAQSSVLFEFLRIMKTASVFPLGAGIAQGVFVRASVDIVPQPIRERLALGAEWDLRDWERALVETLVKVLDRTPLDGMPPVDACLRLGLPGDYLFNDRLRNAG